MNLKITITKQIAKRLREARLKAGFKSLKDFTVLNSIPLSTYSQHETGKRAINAELILIYSELLDINPDWLLTGNNQNLETTEMQAKELLKIIFLETESLFYDNSIKLSYRELIDYCFDIYNVVSPLTINIEEKKNIIKLSINSIQLGTLPNLIKNNKRI